MTRAPSDGNDGVESTDAPVGRPLECSQLVWQRAISLAGSHKGTDRAVVVLDLLRTADHGPSTMLHALTLGRAQQRATPEDIPTRNAVRLLAGAIAWLGKRTEKDEVGIWCLSAAADADAGRGHRIGIEVASPYVSSGVPDGK